MCVDTHVWAHVLLCVGVGAGAVRALGIAFQCPQSPHIRRVRFVAHRDLRQASSNVQLVTCCGLLAVQVAEQDKYAFPLRKRAVHVYTEAQRVLDFRAVCEVGAWLRG